MLDSSRLRGLYWPWLTCRNLRQRKAVGLGGGDVATEARQTGWDELDAVEFCARVDWAGVDEDFFDGDSGERERSSMMDANKVSRCHWWCGCRESWSRGRYSHSYTKQFN